jgi:hypothetical protein
VNKIIRFFPDTHLGQSHFGLSSIAREVGLDTKKLEPGEFYVFMNKAKTAVKIFTGNNIIAYYKHPEGRRIELKTITLIPKYFSGKSFQYEKALEEVIEKELMKKAA